MNPIEKLRKEIDRVDDQLLKLLIQRGGFAKKIGQAKQKSGDDVYSSAREMEILSRLTSKNVDPYHSEDIEIIFQEILNACRNIQKKIRVAYLGPEATFTHQLAIKHFGSGSDMLPQKSISDVFVEVEKGRADYGVVPIENSTEGVVNHTLDMFMESDLAICAEREESIHHYLLSSSGQLSKIKHVYSKDQALAQCRKWLETHLPNVELHDSASTSLAAVQASLDATSAAIASPLAGKLHNLKVVAPNIEDFDENYTRFLVIGKKFPSKSARDKTSVMLSIKDKVGALNDILMVFKGFGLNLTKIESRPSKKKAWEYIFFVDFLGHADDPNIQKALKEVQKSCVFLKVLGSYPKGE